MSRWEVCPGGVGWVFPCVWVYHGTWDTHPSSPLVLTPNGSDQNMYSWQAGSAYLTGMLSCFEIFLQILIDHHCEIRSESSDSVSVGVPRATWCLK